MRWMIFLVWICGVARADVRLAKVFTSGMVIQQEMGIRVWGWADAGEKVSVEFNGKSASVETGADGKWRVELPAMKADGAAHTLSVKGKNSIELTDVVLGEVWLAVGQSNMSRGLRYVKDRVKKEEMDFKNYRLFFVGLDQVPQRDEPAVVKGWAPASHASMNAVFVHPTLGPYEFSEVTYYFGKALHEKLNVPVGMVSAAFPGSTVGQWTPADDPAKRFDFAAEKADKGAGSMYQAMLNGIPPLAMRGVIYYQGENDAGNAKYADDLKKMIEAWRVKFENPELRFYMTQIAQTTFGGGMLRVTEAQQWVTEHVPQTALASSNDLWDGQSPEKAKLKPEKVTGWPTMGGGDPHPPNKHVVAGRLAKIALAKTYGRDEGESMGPMVASFEIRGETVAVKFKNVGKGLKTDDGAAPNWFEVAGEDKKFVKAEAKIVGADVVELTSNEVKAPKVFRFGWHALARHNLYNSENLAGISFRGEK